MSKQSKQPPTARRLILAAVYAAVNSLIGHSAHAGDYGSVVVFGDSLSDVGNAYNSDFHLSPTSPYYNGRFSNGLLWVEDLATDLSLAAPTPSTTSGGKDYAYGGVITGSGNTTVGGVFSFPNLGTQISSYLQSNTPTASNLYVVWGGGNDFLNGQTDPTVPVNNIAAHVTALANAGAKTIIVPNLPLLGEVPRNRGTSKQASLDNLTSTFNSDLHSTLTSLATSLNIHIDQLDVASLLSGAIANPSAYGLTNVTQQADNNGTVVSNPDQYLFWDDIHPTRIGHQMIANTAFDLVSTHNWTAAASSATWGTTSNWDQNNAFDATWIANIANTTTTAKTANVAANSTVRQIHVSGFTSGGNVGTMAIAIQSGVTLAASQTVTIGSAGQIDLQSGSLSCSSITIQSAGLLSGSGTVVGNISSGGAIAPNTQKPLNITGALTQTSSGSTHISLAGISSGQFSTMQITGAATFNGNLAVSATGGFIPLPGESFRVLSFGSRSGSLSIVNNTSYVGLHFNPTFTATDLTLTASATNGDVNLDGTINSMDFDTLANNFGASGRNWLTGDFNGDGIVNTLDFNALATNYGKGSTSAQPAAMLPEPVGGLLVIWLAIGGLMTRQRSSGSSK